MELTKPPSDHLFELVGRILHHVQDMSTPSHVVPVYHDPFRKDEFETFCSKLLYTKLKGIEKPEKDSISIDPASPMEIYEQAAEKMLQYLDSVESKFEVTVDGKPRKIGWHYFWRPFNVSVNSSGLFQGFGTFGPLAQKFGAEKIDTEEGRFELDRIHYENLLSYIAGKSLKDSLRALLAVGRKLRL